MPYYAQLTDGVVTAVTETSHLLPISDNLIQIDGFYLDILSMRYENGEFIPIVELKSD